MLKIIIADDHQIVRNGLKQIVSETKGITVAGEAANGSELLKKIREQKFDVVVMDISMPGRNGIDVLKQLKLEYPKLPVLVLTMFSFKDYGLRALNAGASGYIMKERIAEELIESIKKVASGKKYVSEQFSEFILENISNENTTILHNNLSDRELEVIHLIGIGNTISEISNKLNLSIKTVSTYKGRILEKLKLSSLADIVKYALAHNL